MQKSYSIAFEPKAETSRDSNNPSSAVPSSGLAPRPAVIAQGNWKFVEQLLQVRLVVSNVASWWLPNSSRLGMQNKNETFISRENGK